MIFKKKRTVAENMFDKAFAALPNVVKLRVAFQICFYDFLLETIDKSIINRIVADTGFTIATDMKNIVYYNIVRSLRMDSFKNYSIMHIAPVGLDPIESYKTDLLLCIANRNNSDIKNPNQIKDELIEKDDRVSFMQMMTRIYAANGKEFEESYYSKHQELYQEYSFIVNEYFNDFLKLSGKMENKIVIKRALKTVNTLSDTAVALFATKALLLKVWSNN